MAPRKPDYSYERGMYHLLTAPRPGVITALGEAADYNKLLEISSPLEQIIRSGETLIPDIYINATQDATETVKGKLKIWGVLRGDADGPRLFPFWDGRKYAWFQAMATSRLSVPAGIYGDTSSGGNTIVNDTSGNYVNFTTSTALGSETRVNASTAFTFGNPNFEGYWKFALSQLTNCRFHCYLANSIPGNSDTNATVAVLGLRFSSSASATNWQWVYNDTSGNWNTTNSVTATAGEVLQLYIRCSGGTYIGRLYSSSGTELDAINFSGDVPATTTTFNHGINVFNAVGGVGSAKGFFLYSIGSCYK